MGLQQKLDKATIRTKRKLFDNSIKNLGLDVDAIRIRLNEDIYGNESEPSILLQDSIHCIINYPPELPLFRSRGDNNSVNPDFPQYEDSDLQGSSTTGIYFHEIFPIEIYTKWEDNIEKGDFVIHQIEDEQYNDLKIILKVSDALGSFRSSLIWKKYNASLYNGKFEDMIWNRIDNI